MSDTIDLAVIGAGPAGMSAAIEAARLGLSVTVLDEQPEPGGQIYRGIETLMRTRPRHAGILGADYRRGESLVNFFRAAAIDYRPGSEVWSASPQDGVYYRGAGGSAHVSAKHTLIATGAMERPFPVPGWTLPGVLTCGAAQTALKAYGLVPRGRLVIAGAGPLLLLITAQLVRAGIRPAAVLETTFNMRAALRHALRFAHAPGYFSKGIALMREVKRAGVRVERAVESLAIKGDGRVQSVEYSRRGKRCEEPADVVLLHHGVVPNGNLAHAMRLQHVWDENQRSFRPKLDRWGRSSVHGVLVAGDSGGVVGAIAAEHAGRIAALAAAEACGRITAGERDAYAAALRDELDRHLAARPFLDALYRPAQRWLAPRAAETIVCRCEEVTAGTIRDIVTRHNCPGPNQLKAYARCGMGPCQGRLCGLTVVELLAECRHTTPAEIGYYRLRSPVKPVTLGEIAALDVEEDSATSSAPPPRAASA